jgi:predicted Zn-dependent peptidase
MRGVTAEDVQRVAKEWLGPKNRTTGVLLPEGPPEAPSAAPAAHGEATP